MNERKYMIFLLLLCSMLLPGQVVQNYILSTTYLDGNGTNRIIEKEYYDGLGHPFQKVVSGVNTSGKHVHTVQEYDGKGRVCKEWLPFVGGTSPDCLPASSVPGMSVATYNDGNAHTETGYDALDRPISKAFPGDAWRSAEKKTEIRYVTNSANSVRRYEAPLDKVSLVKSGFYEASSLYGEERIDEDGNKLEVFRDKQGRTILERRNGSNDTYYVYNILGQLRYVLSPEYQHSGYKALYAYEYRYDKRGNCVKKILPGCDYIQYWYDRAGRQTFMQDARLRSEGLYRFMLYDALGRRVLEGVCSSCDRGDAVNPVTFTGLLSDFCSTGYALRDASRISGAQVEVAYYYDNYTFLNVYRDRLLGLVDTLHMTSSAVAGGLQTGCVQTVSNGGLWVEAAYYDSKGRPKETRAVTPANRYVRNCTHYSYSGKVLQSRMTEYRLIGGIQILQADATLTNTYHAASNLLTSIILTVGNGHSTQTRTIRTLQYDDLGRVVKHIHSGSAGATGYEYNLRGWVTRLFGKGYEEELFYTDGPGTPRYNGNISSRLWTTDGGDLYRGYKYTYDALNRLTRAEYGEHRDISDNPNRYTEAVLSYTANGAIERLQRHGLKDDGVYGKIDNLNISLDGNRIVEVTDDALPVNRTGAADFRDGADLLVEYTYNGNGALVSDANKGIACIEYDRRNHPKQIQFTNGNTIRYVYSPLGKKLRTVHLTAVDNVVVPMGSVMELSADQILFADSTDYSGSFVYENDQISRFLFTGGYVDMNRTGTPAFRYYTQDYQGNNRVVVDESGNILQSVHYYPFGGVYADAGTGQQAQPYKFGGKELDRMHGLDWYDFGARSYDAAGVPMFTSVDPMAEKLYTISPYAYCAGDPVNKVDRNGEWVETVWDVFNISLGIKSFTENIQSGNYWDATVDAGGILVDAAAAIVPAVPGGVGAGIKAARGGADAVKAMKRGRNAEKAVLNSLGLKKNTEMFSVDIEMKGGLGKQKVNTIPDAIDEYIYEIKDVKYQSLTKQIRAEETIHPNKKLKLIIHKDTKISKPLQKEIEDKKIELQYIEDIFNYNDFE